MDAKKKHKRVPLKLLPRCEVTRHGSASLDTTTSAHAQTTVAQLTVHACVWRSANLKACYEHQNKCRLLKSSVSAEPARNVSALPNILVKTIGWNHFIFITIYISERQIVLS